MRRLGTPDITAFSRTRATGLATAHPTSRRHAAPSPRSVTCATNTEKGAIHRMQTETKDYLLISDFDQTLSFNDSGIVLSELIGVRGFRDRVDGLAGIHLVQQGGELAYLILHDPEFRCVRREHLREAGKRIRLKSNIAMLSSMLQNVD